MNNVTTNKIRKRYYNTVFRLCKKYLNKQYKPVRTASFTTINDLEAYVFQTPIEELFLQIHRRVQMGFAKIVYDEIKSSSKAETDIVNYWEQEVIRYVQVEAAVKINYITETTRRLVRGILREGLEDGLSIKDIAKKLRTQMPALIESRAILIARTEIVAASNAGSLMAAKSTGLKLKKVWLATGGKRTRDAHRAANGQSVDQDQPFSVKGELLMYPGDTSLGASPSNTIQCRCSIRFTPAAS